MTNRDKILDKIGERLKELVWSRIEDNPEEYYIRTNYGTGYDTGAAATEDVYDRIRAKEEVIDFHEWCEDDLMRELIDELLYMV